MGAAAGPRSFARQRIGRVVEIRALRLAGLSDIDRLHAEVRAALHRAGPGAFVYADHRCASPVSTEVADSWARGMRAANRGVARSAILLDPANVTFNLQMERIVRCAGSPSRRLFSSIEELHAWMDRDATEPERRVIARLFPSAGRDPGWDAAGDDLL